MNAIVLYLIEIALTAALCAGLVGTLRPSLRGILEDLCGTKQRAHFWMIFSSILLVGLPLVFGMGYHPTAGASDTLFFEIAGQVRWNLLGFLLALLGAGGVISIFSLMAPRPGTK